MDNDRNDDAPLATPPMPRERMGPFMILGVSKDAGNESIEAAWAQRVLWARQGKTRIPLVDIHWARAVLREPAQRLAADAASLNPDVAAEELRRLTKAWHLDNRPAWAPHDPEPPAEESPVPDLDEARAGVTAPAVPVDLPGVARWLDAFAHGPLDPWGLNLPSAESRKTG
jgi:hypothetical protein